MRMFLLTLGVLGLLSIVNATAAEYSSKGDAFQIKSIRTLNPPSKSSLPVKVTAPNFKASGNDVEIEEVELGHEGVDLITSGSASKHKK